MRGTIRPIALIIQLGALVVAATLLPLLAGLWLDTQLKTTPWITLASTAVGILTAMVAVYSTISSAYKKLS